DVKEICECVNQLLNTYVTKIPEISRLVPDDKINTSSERFKQFYEIICRGNTPLEKDYTLLEKIQLFILKAVSPKKAAEIKENVSRRVETKRAAEKRELYSTFSKNLEELCRNATETLQLYNKSIDALERAVYINIHSAELSQKKGEELQTMLEYKCSERKKLLEKNPINENIPGLADEVFELRSNLRRLDTFSKERINDAEFAISKLAFYKARAGAVEGLLAKYTELLLAAKVYSEQLGLFVQEYNKFGSFEDFKKRFQQADEIVRIVKELYEFERQGMEHSAKLVENGVGEWTPEVQNTSTNDIASRIRLLREKASRLIK
ncbi:MAG: hypothetical protein QXU88_02470, partial [Candidatus Woesearchaeota archaeon]